MGTRSEASSRSAVVWNITPLASGQVQDSGLVAGLFFIHCMVMVPPTSLNYRLPWSPPPPPAPAHWGPAALGLLAVPRARLRTVGDPAFCSFSVYQRMAQSPAAFKAGLQTRLYQCAYPSSSIEWYTLLYFNCDFILLCWLLLLSLKHSEIATVWWTAPYKLLFLLLLVLQQHDTHLVSRCVYTIKFFCSFQSPHLQSLHRDIPSGSHCGT